MERDETQQENRVNPAPSHQSGGAQSGSARRIARYSLIGVVSLLAVMASAVVWLKLHESELVFATARSQQHLRKDLPADAERVSVPVSAGVGLAGLIFHADSGNDTGYWILQLHGNADSAFSVWQMRHCQALRGVGFSVMDVDYRGFGMTPGSASEAGMYEDAEAAYKALLLRGVPPSRVILLGHSLGSGPAVLLATRHEVAALILFGAFTSIPDAAADKYPLLPVRYVTSVQFDSLARMREVHVPVIITHSRADTLVPYSHALRLYAAANEPKRLITFESPADDGFGGHVDTLFEQLDVLKSALAGVLPPAPPPREL
ncbi:MAG: alpha/beta hydrolase [Steroidobacteraceae bacterium]